MNWFTKFRPYRSGGGAGKAWKNLDRELGTLVTPPPRTGPGGGRGPRGEAWAGSPPPPYMAPSDCLHPEDCPARHGVISWTCDCPVMHDQEEKAMPERLPPAPTIHEKVRPFGAPVLRPTISDAYRNSARDITTCVENMLASCEEARQQGLALIDALNEAGDAHEDFVENYIKVATSRAAAVRDAWKRQLEDLTQQTAAMKDALAKQAPVEPSTPEGEQS